MEILYIFIMIFELTATAHTNVFHIRDKRGIAKACRYTNVPWTDCDPTNWMRTKTVRLIEQEQFSNGENCPETREFSQTCSEGELPKGTKVLLEEKRQYTLQQNFFHMKMRETKVFLEETQISLRRINELYRKSRSVSLERYHKYVSIETQIRECDIREQEYTKFKVEFQHLSLKLDKTAELYSMMELENQHLQEQMKKEENDFLDQEKTEDSNWQLEKEQMLQHLNSSEAEVERLNKKVSDLQNNHGLYREKVKSALEKRNKESHKARPTLATLATLDTLDPQKQKAISDKSSQHSNDTFSEVEKCKTENIRLKHEFKSLEINYQKLQDKMTLFLKDKSETKEHQDSLGKDLQKPQNDKSDIQLGTPSNPSTPSTPDSLQIITDKLEKCTTINEKEVQQLVKMKSELGQLKEKYSNMEGKVLTLLDKTNKKKPSITDVNKFDYKKALEIEKKNRFSVVNLLTEKIKRKEEELETWKTLGMQSDDKCKEFVKSDKHEKNNNNEFQTNSTDISEKTIPDIMSINETGNISTLTEATAKFLEIVDLVKKEIENSHRKEGQALDFMKLNLTEILKEHSKSVSLQINKQHSLIADLLEENSHMKQESEKLQETVKNMNSEKSILKVKLISVIKHQIKKEKYISCLSDLTKEKGKYASIYPIVGKLKKNVEAAKASELYKLLKSFKRYRNLYYLALRKENSLQVKLRQQKEITDELSENVKKFLSDFQKLLHNYFGIKTNLKNNQDNKKYQLQGLKTDLGNVHEGVRRLYDDFSMKIKTEQKKVLKISEEFQDMKKGCIKNKNLQENLVTALEVSEKYKTHLKTDQAHLYKCHMQYYKDKKVLKSVYNFYTYLLQRLARLDEGIHHLKVVGHKLRQNLITAHSTLGHCTGNLQGLRHECQGLVNWYQSMPNMEMTKRKLLNCEEEMKTNEVGLFGHYQLVSDDLLTKLGEQKALIKRLTEQARPCTDENINKEVEESSGSGRNTSALDSESVEDEQDIEAKYKKSKQFVAKLVEENTHLRLMIDKYIKDPKTRTDTAEKVYGMLSNVLNGSEADHSFHLKKYKQMKSKLENIEDQVRVFSEESVNHRSLLMDDMTQFYQNSSEFCEKKLHHLESHMKDYLKVLKTLNKNKTCENKRPMEDYLNYIVLIHKSFDLLRERESSLITEIKKCNNKKDDHHLHFHYTKKKTEDDSSDGKPDALAQLFPPSDRAVQMKTNKSEELPEEFYHPQTITLSDKQGFPTDNIETKAGETSGLEDTLDGPNRHVKENTAKHSDFVLPLDSAAWEKKSDLLTPAIDIEKIKSFIDKTG